MAEGETEQIKTDFGEDETYLKTIIFKLQVEQKNQKSNMRGDYFYKIEEENTKNSQKLQTLKAILENIQHDFMKDTQEFLKTYQSQIKERKKQYDTLKVRDESLQALLTKQVEKLRQAFEQIRRLKQTMSECQKLLGRNLKDLEEEHSFFFTAFNFLKNRLIIDREKDAKKLEHLTVCFNEADVHLEKIRTKGEQILHLGEVCRKLETQEEKITPFPYTGVNMETKMFSEEPIKDFCVELELFCQRVGQAEATRFAINEEKEFLKTENRILVMKLQRYCQCLTTPQGKINKRAAEVKHITEGAVEYQKYQKHGSDHFIGKKHFNIDDEVDDEEDVDE